MKASALVPVVAYLGLAGLTSAAPVAIEAEHSLDKRFFCLFGFGWGCNTPTTTSAAPVKTSTASSVVSSTARQTVATSSSAVKSSAVASSSPKPSSTSSVRSTSSASATKSTSASWAQCTDFDWSAWNDKEWQWGGGYNKEYVQNWYLDTYGLNPPSGMNWRQVSSLVSKFGAKTSVSGPKATSKYSKGCSNPWTSAAPVTRTQAATTTTKPVVPTVSSKPVDSASVSKATSIGNASSASASKPVSTASASATVSPSSAATGGPAASASSPSSSSTIAVPSASIDPTVVNGGGAASASSSPSSAVDAPSASPSPATPSASGSAGGSDGTSSGNPGSGTGVPGTGSGVPGTGEASNNGTSTSVEQPLPTSLPPVIVNGYTYGGCAQEVEGRLLAKVQTSSASQTIEACTALCASYGFGVAGLEYGNECYCGTLEDTVDAELSGECYMPCAGNADQICGGPNAINWYYDADIVPPTVQLPDQWSTYGVVSEGTQGRLLSTFLWSSADNTVEKCAQGCAAAGYKVAGTEYSSECFCGNGFTQSAGGGDLLDDSAAFMACSGNLAQKCGGPSVLSVTSAFGKQIPLV